MSTPTYLVDANGEVLEFADPQQAQYALDGGLAPASEEQAAAFQKRDALLRENSTLGAQVRGEVEGFGRGLTFGGTDLAARALGVDAEGMAVRRELSSGVGEFTGALAPILAGGLPGALGSVGAQDRVDRGCGDGQRVRDDRDRVAGVVAGEDGGRGGVGHATNNLRFARAAFRRTTTS